MRKVELPSGKVIVVRRHLQICPECKATNVTPVRWDEVGSDHWDVDLRCPDCEHWQSLSSVPQDDIDDYDLYLSDEEDEMRRAYLKMRRWAMLGFFDVFMAALDADAIWPDDFAS